MTCTATSSFASEIKRYGGVVVAVELASGEEIAKALHN